MAFRTTAKASNDLDGLRLLALGRIPRCGSCPRFSSLVAAHDGRVVPDIGAVPASCTHQVCAPLAARFRPPAAALRARPRDLPPQADRLLRVSPR